MATGFKIDGIKLVINLCFLGTKVFYYDSFQTELAVKEWLKAKTIIFGPKREV